MSDEAKKEPTSIQKYKASGQATEARRREIHGMVQSLRDSDQWGKVQGRRLSEGSLYALARMCHVTKADPILDIDLLGGHPYHNANYYIRRAMNHERYVKHEEINILADTAKRTEFGVPEDAMGAYVVRIHLYLPSAPMAAIKAGRIPFEEAMKWTTVVEAANWAGDQRRKKGKQGWYKSEDVIGMSEPDKTARTRAFRKAAAKAFGAEFIDEQAIQQAEQMVEAEWSYDEEPARADVAGGEIAVGHGEPAAAVAESDRADFEHEIVSDGGLEPEPEVDLNERRRWFFATLAAIGVDRKDSAARKRFMAEHGLPDSVTKFTAADYARIEDAIMTPLKAEVEKLCEQADTSLEDISLQELQMGAPEYARDWVHLRDTLTLRVRRQQQLVDDDGQGVIL
ncbi:MAG: hypothetical protein OXQ93_17225 [Gemmatimonadota bacterium]|nr:hypothetical protein [Gemmatimonadota bacterium]